MSPKSTSADSARAIDWARQTGALDQVRARISHHVNQKARKRKRVIRASSALVLLVIFSAWLVPFVKDTGTIHAPIGQRATHQLADGSQAELNARTELKTDFRYGRRMVHLTQGEAFFAVVSDPNRPFLVETPAGTVRVTGTKFNVRLTEQGLAEVTLLEGRVALEHSEAQPLVLHPGEQARSDETSSRRLDALALENATAWRENRFVMDGLTLGEAARRFGAYHGHPITVDVAVAELRAAGTCPLDDFPGFLDALRSTFPIRVMTQTDGSYRLLAK